jgi:hypothetical protein
MKKIILNILFYTIGFFILVVFYIIQFIWKLIHAIMDM